MVNLQTNYKAAAHNQCSNVIDVIDEKPNNVLIKAFRRQIKLFTDEFIVNDHFLPPQFNPYPYIYSLHRCTLGTRFQLFLHRIGNELA